MTGTLRSLRDWLTDQLAEVRHAAPVAVIAPVDTVTAADLVLAPGLDQIPVCEQGLITDPPVPCDQPALVSARVRHLVPECGPTAVLLCGECLTLATAAIRAAIEAPGGAHCETCRVNLTSLADVIPLVIPL